MQKFEKGTFSTKNRARTFARIHRVSRETLQLVNSFECLLPYILLDNKDFLEFISLKKFFLLKYILLWNNVTIKWLPYNMLLLSLVSNINKLWKKTFVTICQLSCFVGHPVYKTEFCCNTYFWIYMQKISVLRQF